jgi:hypothetical protein
LPRTAPHCRSALSRRFCSAVVVPLI